LIYLRKNVKDSVRARPHVPSLSATVSAHWRTKIIKFQWRH